MKGRVASPPSFVAPSAERNTVARQAQLRSLRDDIQRRLAYFLADPASQERKRLLLLAMRSVDSAHAEVHQQLRSDVEALSVDVERLKAELINAQQRGTQQREDLRSNDAQAEQLRGKLTHISTVVHDQHRHYAGQISSLDSELHLSRGRVQVLENEISNAEFNLDACQRSITEVQAALLTANEELSRLRDCEDRWLHNLVQSSMRPVLGVEVREVKPSKSDVQLVVAAIAKGGAAEAAGLEPGDIITKFDQIDIVGKLDFAKAVLTSKIGSPVIIQVVRQRQTPTGKPSTSVEYIPVTVAGAKPTGVDVEGLRQVANPVEFVQAAKEGRVTRPNTPAPPTSPTPSASPSPVPPQRFETVRPDTPHPEMMRVPQNIPHHPHPQPQQQQQQYPIRRAPQQGMNQIVPAAPFPQAAAPGFFQGMAAPGPWGRWGV
eukprot:TRINITY_DN31691_c0_g1_i1.p1 TRINITY_DN31691_c0_g1~~TRINITY_DN31691_c0_g1_i1.p1  ORF type:complete len:451 (+),score=56.02 TRINITY_DN31691_c0_g1_i1:57-1355(+)